MEKTDYPALMQDADAASLAGQGWYKRVTRLDLIVIVLGSAVGATITLLPGGGKNWAASLAAFFLLTGVIAKLVARTRLDDKQWFNGRAVAETVKSLSWQYMMREEPFKDDVDCDVRFSRHIQEARHAAAALRSPGITSNARPQQITDFMRKQRAMPMADRKLFYIEHRLNDQIGWYDTKAKFNQARSEQWFWVSIGAQLMAILWAILLATEVLSQLNLVGMFGAIATAATAWLQLGDHDELAQSYRLAAHELIMIRDITEQADSEESFGEAVRNGEQAISREHKMWMANRENPASILFVEVV